ncbi:MAG TPA: hypothetical protein VIV63_03820 [Steroidobacteraceae bacterium]
MNFQERMLEATAQLRARTAALATVAVTTARTQAQVAAKRVGGLKGSLTALKTVGRELNKVARLHGTRFVKENSAIAVGAGKDLSALARTTYAALAKRPAAARKTRKAPAARKRAARKAA